MKCLTDLIILLVALESLFKNWHSDYYNITFRSLSSRITLLSNSYHHVEFEIYKCLIARGSDLF